MLKTHFKVILIGVGFQNDKILRKIYKLVVTEYNVR